MQNIPRQRSFISRVLWRDAISEAQPLHYAGPARARVKLEISDLRGRRVATVLREAPTPGKQVIGWDVRDPDVRPVPSGHYFARLTVRGSRLKRSLNRKITVLL